MLITTYVTSCFIVEHKGYCDTLVVFLFSTIDKSPCEVCCVLALGNVSWSVLQRQTTNYQAINLIYYINYLISYSVLEAVKEDFGCAPSVEDVEG